MVVENTYNGNAWSHFTNKFICILVSVKKPYTVFILRQLHNTQDLNILISSLVKKKIIFLCNVPNHI